MLSYYYFKVFESSLFTHNAISSAWNSFFFLFFYAFLSRDDLNSDLQRGQRVQTFTTTTTLNTEQYQLAIKVSADNYTTTLVVMY